MQALIVTIVVTAVAVLIGLALSMKVVTQYEKGVLFRLGRVIAVKEPGLRFIIPVVDRPARVSLQLITIPIQTRGIVTRDNVSVDISSVSHFRVVDAMKSVVAIQDVDYAINQIAQTTLRKVVGHRRPQCWHSANPRHHHPRMGSRGHTRRTEGHPTTRQYETSAIGGLRSFPARESAAAATFVPTSVPPGPHQTRQAAPDTVNFEAVRS